MQKEDTLAVTHQDFSGIDSIFRNLALGVLSKLTQGGLVVKERGQKVGYFGLEGSDLIAEVDIRHPDCYRRFMLGGSIAAAELFMEERWTTPDLAPVVRLFARNLPVLDAVNASLSWFLLPLRKWQHWRRNNSRRRARDNIAAHYDRGNELYQAFLDPMLQYSSAVYPYADADLAEAQAYKLRLLCDKLELKPTDHLLEIGSGWGGLAVFAAKNYGCRITTTTISEQQYRYTRALLKKERLDDQVTLLKKDYRELTGRYDKLVSVEMIEAVGHQYMANFFKTCDLLLKADGKMVLQAITIADQRLKKYTNSVDFIQRHIFPGGFLPSLTMMTQMLTKHTDMVVRQVNDIGLDYARTVGCWRERFNRTHPQLKQQGYNDDFARMWNYYLCYCEGGFLERRISAVQLVATKPEYR